MRKVKEINEYMDEAFDIVWFVRTLGLMANGDFNDTPKEILDEAKTNVERICKSHGIKSDKELLEFCTDWNYGYWSGILAALRWVMGDEKDFLDT